MKFWGLFIILALPLILASCYVETATANKERSLVIASDYLHAGDSLIFAAFSKQHKVHIEIKHIQTNNLIGVYRNNGYDHGIDIVMMRSLFDISELNKHDLFHDIEQVEIDSDLFARYGSSKYKFMGFGIDPYIVLSDPDSTVSISTYAELKQQDFINTLEDEDLIPMLASLMKKMDRVKTYNWVKEMMSHERRIKNENKQSTRELNFVLSLRQGSKELMQSDSLLMRYQSITYPNSRTSGTFYNLRTFCIMNQAQNFVESKDFIKFYLDKEKNEELNAHFETSSILSKTNEFRQYHAKSDDLIQYYAMIRRILHKIRSTQ